MLRKRLFHHRGERAQFLDRLFIAPHQHAIDVPVAALEGAAIDVIDRLAQDQRALLKGAADERLAGEVNRLVLERLVLVLGQEHGNAPPRVKGCLDALISLKRECGIMLHERAAVKPYVAWFTRMNDNPPDMKLI